MTPDQRSEHVYEVGQTLRQFGWQASESDLDRLNHLDQVISYQSLDHAVAVMVTEGGNPDKDLRHLSELTSLSDYRQNDFLIASGTLAEHAYDLAVVTPEYASSRDGLALQARLARELAEDGSVVVIAGEEELSVSKQEFLRLHPGGLGAHLALAFQHPDTPAYHGLLRFVAEGVELQRQQELTELRRQLSDGELAAA